MSETKVHLGCGDVRLADYLNVDCRRTPAVDRIVDLEDPVFPPGSVDVAFGNAFFEHLRRDAQARHLKAMAGALRPDGLLCYSGIPWFPGIAAAYADGGLDLYGVYRYTHGDPEGVAEYFPQLHKAIFDGPEIFGLLDRAGLGPGCVFTYVYPGEALRVTCGFANRPFVEAAAFLKDWDGRFLLHGTLREETR
jgi:SAM-dependent methyltransferase